MVNPTHLVAAGGLIGAVARHYVGEFVEREAEPFPLGTLTVNVVGSFVLGLVSFLDPGSDVLLFVGTGACGSFTTFSSFSVAVVQLWEDEERLVATTYALVNLVGSVVAIGGAWALINGI